MLISSNFLYLEVYLQKQSTQRCTLIYVFFASTVPVNNRCKKNELCKSRNIIATFCNLNINLQHGYNIMYLILNYP